MAKNKKPANWDKVPDDHKCLGCNKTKHDGVNFYFNTHQERVYKICNVCKRKGVEIARVLKKEYTERNRKGAYWDLVPDDHRCSICDKTKYEKRNFNFHLIDGLPRKPKDRCTKCGDTNHSNLPANKIAIKERIDLYFKTKEYN